MHQPGTIVVASDRKYEVQRNGEWRVIEYLPDHWAHKKFARKVTAVQEMLMKAN